MGRGAVRQFEVEFAAYQGAAEARAFWKGRVGLYAVLRALGIGAGDRVAVCAFTCSGVLEAVARLSAIPLFLDVDRHLNVASAALDRLAVPPAALVLQYTFGVPAGVETCLQWAAARGVPVVEDCCHALGATWDGRRVGNYGCAAIFSFQWSKPFSTGQGGMLTFPEAALAREVDRVLAREAVAPSFRESAGLSVQRALDRCLVTPAMTAAARSVYQLACRRGWVDDSESQFMGRVGPAPAFLKRASPAQARAGLHQLRRWPESLRRRCEAAAVLQARFRRYGIEFVEPEHRASPVYLRCPVWVWRKPYVLERAEQSHLDIAGWYASAGAPLSDADVAALGYVPVACPLAEEAFARVITLPTAPALSAAALERALRIIDAA